MNLYFTLKAWFFYIIPAIIITLTLIIVIIKAVLDVCKESKIEDFFINNNYEKHTEHNVVCPNETYDIWIRYADGKRANMTVVKHWPMAKIVEQYK